MLSIPWLILSENGTTIPRYHNELTFLINKKNCFRLLSHSKHLTEILVRFSTFTVFIGQVTHDPKKGV